MGLSEKCARFLTVPAAWRAPGATPRRSWSTKIAVTGLGDYTRNVGCKTGSVTYEFETKTFNYDRGIKLPADVMDVEEAGVLASNWPLHPLVRIAMPGMNACCLSDPYP